MAIFLWYIFFVSGKRTPSKMNAFDFIVTIALGSCLSAISLNKEISLSEGVLVYCTLIFLQALLTWTSARVKNVRKIITAQPTLLLYKGEPLENAMKKERITAQEMYAAARKKGIAGMKEIEAIVLETTGDLTIISKTEGTAETLKNVSGYPPV